MQRYADYAPTQFDAKGLLLPDKQDWIVLMGRNRDSSHLDLSNFDQALEALGGEGDDVQVHRFGHWACGWIENIIYRPGSDAALLAEKIRERLAGYPVLNEQDFCEREWNAYTEAWTSWGARSFINDLVKKLELDEATEEALDALEKEHCLQLFFEKLVPSGDFNDEGSPAVSRAIANATIDDVTEFLANRQVSEAADAAQPELPLGDETAP